MKKLTLTAIALIMMSAMTFGQLANGSNAPSFTLTDINGNTIDLYTLTGQGKTVFINISATWSSPAWNYHNSNSLDSLYNEHGPSGTVDTICTVLHIEADGATTLADLQGTGTNTQGDWVTGTPFPIIDVPPAQALAFQASWAVSYFSIVYMVCPNNLVYEIGQSTMGEMLTMIGTCPYPLDAAPAGAQSLYCGTTIFPVVNLKNNSVSTTLTSCDITFDIDGGTPQLYSWNGTLSAGGTTAVTLTPQTVTAGAHTLNVTTTNPNGGTDGNPYNSTAAYPLFVSQSIAVQPPVAEDFTSVTYPPTDWALVNPDQGTTLSRVAGAGNPAPCIKLDAFNYPDIGATDELVMAPMDLTNPMSTMLTFDVAYRPYDAQYFERLQVFVSTNCGASWVQVYNKAGTTLQTGIATTVDWTPMSSAEWRNESVSLNAFVGMNNVYVKFLTTNGFGNNLYIDNITVTQTTDVADLPALAGISLFPNPARDMATITFDHPVGGTVVVNVYDMTGNLVSTKNEGDLPAGTQTSVTLSTESLSEGLYTVELIASDTRKVARMSVIK